MNIWTNLPKVDDVGWPTLLVLVRVLDDVGVAAEEHPVLVLLERDHLEVLDAEDLLLALGVVGHESDRRSSRLGHAPPVLGVKASDIPEKRCLRVTIMEV